MSLETERLISLIEFAKQTARMRRNPARAVSDHGLASVFEHEIRGLPGVQLNAGGDEAEDEVWLTVERLHETKPPSLSATLRPWVQLSQSPADEPSLRRAVSGADLIEAGTHTASGGLATAGKPSVAPDASFALEAFPSAQELRREFANYQTLWRDWSEAEKQRRKTIRVYSQLYTLKQQLEGGIVEAQLELVWGVGLGVVAAAGTTVSYPLLAQPVELTLNTLTGAIWVRPRDTEVRLQLDWYASMENPGVATLEKVAAEFFGKANSTFSPFDRGTFEPVLRAASSHLDANGRYWPDVVPSDDRSMPRPEEALKVTDTWVLFARTRDNSLFIQDLEKLKSAASAAEFLPPAVEALVTEPATVNSALELPAFRGVSTTASADSVGSAAHPRDLFFPKAFNDEQTRIVQLLEISNGVVVQGPPGTGKTHTIANVICHYLAVGKRVLVTSMKDAALGVLQGQIPAEIRPLTISLLASEKDGMKQFEHAIQKIASEVQGLDRTRFAKEIKHLGEAIDALHARIAGIDRNINEWAVRNLSKIPLDGETLDPEDVARDLVESGSQFDWLPDQLTIAVEHFPKFSDSHIVRLRDARRALGADIDYLEASLPQLSDFPEAKDLLVLHQDLSRLEVLRLEAEEGMVPALANSSDDLLKTGETLLARVESLRTLRAEVAQAGGQWTARLRDRLRSRGQSGAVEMFERLCAELDQAAETRKAFLRRPVSIAKDTELDTPVVAAVANLANGRSAFGLSGVFGKRDKKSILDAVRVLGAPPRDAESWRHVEKYLALNNRFRELALRWNTLAGELQLGAKVDVTPDGGQRAATGAVLATKVKLLVATELEISFGARAIFPNWSGASEVAVDSDRLAELELALRHHLARGRLSDVWARKEQCKKALDGRSGRVVRDIRTFFDGDLGQSTFSDSTLQLKWSALMTELSRASGLAANLNVVREVSAVFEQCGAHKYAALLREPVTGPVDELLPDSLRSAWQLRRLNTHLESIDPGHDLQRLAGERRNAEGDLAKAYRDVVTNRTWLKLAENASPSIKSALQAYLNAIQKIGKGTGKRAARFRTDARAAAALANPAVPCWIMAHHRVSESLPAELGCFDLVIIDEASQSDLSALPALLRAQKVLIVGDDKQVSPEGVGLEEEKVKNLMSRFLSAQVPTYRMQMSPERSIYDLYKVVFAQSSVMLKEHFRCVGPIIEYSKREHYNHELKPLRLPRASERLDPPLIDVLVRDGYRDGDTNRPEARFIVKEIKAITNDPKLSSRSIGVVSLLADKQSFLIWTMIAEELGPDIIDRHNIACGDARTFQGKERDIMFLSMVVARNLRSGGTGRDTFAQRYNVAASRARDRMYLVRSVEASDLGPSDDLRRKLIAHFSAPFAQDTERVADLRSLCESDFEREVYDELTRLGYWVTPQVRVGHYRLDMVVEGHNDARLAVECDGDRYHGADKWADDMKRQRVLERAGWVFWRSFASAFVRRRSDVVADLVRTLRDRGIEPIGAEGAPRSVHTERREVDSSAL